MQPFTHTNNKHEHTFSHPTMQFVQPQNINKTLLFFFALHFLCISSFLRHNLLLASNVNESMSLSSITLHYKLNYQAKKLLEHQSQLQSD